MTSTPLPHARIKAFDGCVAILETLSSEDRDAVVRALYMFCRMKPSDLPERWRNQFLSVREIPGLGTCGVQRFASTCGLLTNMRFDGEAFYYYDARYCYELASDAQRALLEWDGKGDPPGEWIKEKVSERYRVEKKDPDT